MDSTSLFAILFGTGMILNAGAQVTKGYFGWQQAQMEASTAEAITSRRASAAENIASSQAMGAVMVNQINANAAVEQTRWAVFGMVLAANAQYMNNSMRLQYAEMASQRNEFTLRQQMSHQATYNTLAANAEIRSQDRTHEETMTSMQLQHEERMAEIERPQEIDLSSLLT